jgi:hypothetical protein
MGHREHDWIPLPLFVDGRILAAGAEQPTGGQEAAAVLRWIEQAKITSVSSPADVEGLSPGSLVEVAGRTCGNPMVALLDLVATSIPLVLDTAPTPPKRPGGRTTADGPTTSKAPSGQDTSSVEEQRIMAGLIAAARDGLRSSPVIDVVLLTEGGLAVVLPVDRSILGAAGEALLDDGEYRVIGKVSAVIGEDEGISLLRRSLLAATGPAAAREMLAELAGTAAGIDLPDPVIDGPALQVIPIAILL